MSFKQNYKLGPGYKGPIIKRGENSPRPYDCLDYGTSSNPTGLDAPNVFFVDIELIEFDEEDNTYRCKILKEEISNRIGKIWLPDSFIRLAGPTVSTGMSCFECKNGYPYAEPNFEDKLVCWSCCDSLGWKYSKDKTTGKVTAR